ncbi:autotransporter domain-containing protein [Aliarcobacter cryaerophilus]|uniref:autotransporter family protein n=1 Tax=Aliarcobacter cryaerophilus TaxID=28198 RepID=UPI0021B66D06|nr:autotransporter outer membrane beta-barrel domain-containing protein [Aliarcobacter cryaerophilus]MCT7485572.1 autotransporter domain-containing protein [Aliarcobacter cryaerophilus]MCT7491341.1 autotransporter domain-containing protein [Aliarcobacter cryaerophilus]
MNRISNFKNRFRILKGGKVSLVVSAMLLSSTVFVNSANADVCDDSNKDASPLTCERTEMKVLNEGGSFEISDTGSIVITTFDNNNFTGIKSTSNNNNGSTITNNGKIIIGNKPSGTSSGMYILGSGSTGVTINNNGLIDNYSNNSNNYAHSLNLTGLVLVNNSGTLRGNISVSGDSRLINSGTIELSEYSIGSYSGRINYLKNESTGKLIIGLKTDGTLTGSQYSKVFTNSAIFKDGSTIGVNVLDSSTNVALLAGSKLSNVVIAQNNLTIDGKLNITDNSALLDFEYETTKYYNTNDAFVNGEDGAIHLKAVKAKNGGGNSGGGGDKTILSSTIAGNGNQNDQNAARALESLYNSNSDVASAFNKLPTDSSVARAVESTTPAATNASIGAATQISNGISSIVTQRQNANISNSGLNSGDGMFSENNLWIKPFGSIGKQNSKDGINGFDLKTYGLGFGADTEIKDNSKLGLAFFYTNGSVDTKGVNQKADLDVYTALVYGNVPIIDDKTNFLYQAGYSVQKTNTKRDVFTGQTAEAKYNSKIASLDLKLMRDFQISDSFLLQPLVNTTYRHFTNPSYSESGAGALNLKVDKFTTSELIVGLGTLAHYKITDNQKLIGSVNVGYDLQNKKQIVTSAYQGNIGTSFDTNGIDNGRWSYEAGIGYELDINKTNNINISYDYQGQGSKFSNNVISAKYVLKF